MSDARSKLSSIVCLILAPNSRRMVATRKKRPARPSRLTNRNGANGIAIAPEAIVATLNGIGVKAAAARNPDAPHACQVDEAVPVVGGPIKVDDRLTNRGHQP